MSRYGDKAVSSVRATGPLMYEGSACPCQRPPASVRPVHDRNRDRDRVLPSVVDCFATILYISTMVSPYLPSKLPLPVDRSQNPTTCLIHGPIRPTMPNSIRIRSAVFPQCTGHTQTDTQTYRWLPGKFDDYRRFRCTDNNAT